MVATDTEPGGRRSRRKRSPDLRERLQFLKSRAPTIIGVGIAILLITAMFFAALSVFAG